MMEGGEPRRSRGFFAVLWEVLRAAPNALFEFAKELVGELVAQLALALAACGAIVALAWGLRTHPVVTGSIAGPVAALAVFGGVLVVRREEGERLPYGKLGVAAAAAFAVVALLLYGAAQGGCSAC